VTQAILPAGRRIKTGLSASLSQRIGLTVESGRALPLSKTLP
jgi:hypothetical protein